jgi:hypothetical protein
MRRLVERRIPELLVAGLARHPHVPHAPAVLGSLPGRRADAGFPADPRHARPQRMTERAAFWLVFENRYRHGTVMPRRAAGHAGGRRSSDHRYRHPSRGTSRPRSTPRASSIPRRWRASASTRMTCSRLNSKEAVANHSVDATSCVVPVPGRIDAAIANSYWTGSTRRSRRPSQRPTRTPQAGPVASGPVTQAGRSGECCRSRRRARRLPASRHRA